MSVFKSIRVALYSLVAAVAMVSGAGAQAQTPFPNHPLRVIVPFTAGGGLDSTTRILVRRLEEVLGQPIVVDNRPGAGGILGVRGFVSSPPDGYTLLMGTAGEVAIAPLLNPDTGYSPTKDLLPVAQVVRAPNVLAVSSSLPVNNLAELVAYAKANPGKLTYSTSGIGTAHHLIGEYLNQLAGISVRHIPFKGAAQQVVDVAAGRVSMTYASPGAVQPYVEKGSLRAIAVTTADRIPSMPNTPAIKDTLPKFEFQSWFGLFAPIGTPPQIVERLNKEVTAILREPAVAKRLGEIAGSPSFDTPAEFAASIARDSANYQRIIKDSGISLN